MKPYRPREVELSRQAIWRARDEFRTPELRDGASGTYVKPASPFTSGELHMGHVRGYTIVDAYARFCRARGEPVLCALGFDAFGLPSELGALEHGETPGSWVKRCGHRMLSQMQRLGFSFDYDRAFYTSDPALYQWSQWLFLALLDADLIYRDTATVDWCGGCQTTLAALRVENGKCWRC